MKKLIGFICFWVAIGMLLAILIPYEFLSIVIMLILLVVGYNMYYLKC